jgi:hypothetical protein
MDCSDVERALVVCEGESPSGSEIEAHLAGCEACQFLVGEGAPVALALAGTMTMTTMPPGATPELAELEIAVGESLAAERGLLGRARALPRPARLAAIAVFALLEPVFFSRFLRRVDWTTYPAWRMAATLGIYALGVVILGWFALRPVYLAPLPRWAPRAILAVGLGLPALIAILPAVATTAPEAEVFNYPGWAYYCFVDGGGLAVAVLLLARCLDRGAHGSRASALAAVSGAAFAGLIGLQIQCPINYPMHLLTGHATIPLGLAAAYLLFRRP